MGTIFYKGIEYGGGGGHEILYGTSVPASSLGESGDMYCRLDGSENLIEEYIKLGNNWTIIPKSDAVLGTKTITANGTYAASSDNLDGFSSVEINVSGGGSASLERLCYAYEDYNELGTLDHTHIAYFDSITKDTNYDNYLSNTSITPGSQTEVTFTVTQAFTALLTVWVTNYQTASGGTTSEGQIYINNQNIMEGLGYWNDRYKCEDATVDTKAGLSIVRTFSVGDTFYIKTPSNDGWPQQSLKVYRVIDNNIPSAFAWS